MEKTFEELIAEKTRTQINDLIINKSSLETYEVLKLLKQVREATIKECRGINHHAIRNQTDLATAEILMNKLPTDRIEIENKER